MASVRVLGREEGGGNGRGRKRREALPAQGVETCGRLGKKMAEVCELLLKSTKTERGCNHEQ